MIVGRGLLARSFASRYLDDDKVVIFASGVSNSLETDPAAFDRERAMLNALLARDPDTLIYFGSCGVANLEEAPTAYMQHKRQMESLVANSTGGLVLRLPQVVGLTENPHTLTNYLRDKIVRGERFSVWAKAERNLIDVDDVAAIAAAVMDEGVGDRKVLAIAAQRSTPMPDIVDIFEKVLDRSALCVMEDKGSALPIDSDLAVRIGARLGIDLGPGYDERIIRKYYGAH